MIGSNFDISTLSSQSSLNRLESLASRRNDEKEIDKVAGEFQAMCYAHLVKSMFASTEESALWGDSHAAGILHSMFIEAVANSGGAESLNIRASIKKSLYQNMEQVEAESVSKDGPSGQARGTLELMDTGHHPQQFPYGLTVGSSVSNPPKQEPINVLL